MTKQERDLQSQQRESIRLQKEASLEIFKQNARFKALDVAQSLNPNRYTYSSGAGELAKNNSKFDIVKKADEIYQWIIKNAK